VTFSDGQGKKADPARAEPYPLQNNDPARLLQNGPLMIVATGTNNAGSWMLAIRVDADCEIRRRRERLRAGTTLSAWIAL
jgi:hypothetical protein